MSENGKWLDGKVVFAAGGGSGIGRAVVEAFVDQGASVGVLERDRSKCAELEELTPAVRAFEGDATAPADAERAVRGTVDAFGPLDVATSFVGVFDHYTALADIPPDVLPGAFKEIFDINVLSALVTARAALDAFDGGRGSIIFTLSSSSFYAARGGPLYVASKFALRGLVVQLAHEVAPNVRVNGVAPGGTVGTDLRGLRSLDLDGNRLEDRPGREDELRARTPLQVALEPADHVGSYLLLASDRAPGITGEILRSDGGLAVR
jgi:2,3-dihydroxy-2,3-dihydrophenylpropionate dehydrogenase